MIAGQTKLAVFIDGWISEAGPARQPTLVAEPTEPTALAAGPMVGGARGALGLANLLMGPGEGCAGRRAIRGNFRGPRIGLWSWWIAGMCWAKRDRRLAAGRMKPAALMARPAEPAALMVGLAISDGVDGCAGKATHIDAGPTGPTGPTALMAGPKAVGAKGAAWNLPMGLLELC